MNSEEEVRDVCAVCVCGGGEGEEGVHVCVEVREGEGELAYMLTFRNLTYFPHVIIVMYFM